MTDINYHGLPHWFVIALFLPVPVFGFLLWTRTPKTKKQFLIGVLMALYGFALFLIFR